LPTQVGRALGELGITHISARSPQAKGRIERLWGTLQDRLVSELRLVGAATLAEANRVLWDFLPPQGARFAVPPAQPGSAYRPRPDGLVLEQVLCFKYGRVVAADNTLRFGGQRLQLLPGRDRLSYARARVEVQERLDGSLAVYYQGRCLLSRPAPPEAPVLRARTGARAGPNPPPQPPPTSPTGRAPRAPAPGARRPAPDHPWRPARRPGRTKSLAT
jgi:hypothetical protein